MVQVLCNKNTTESSTEYIPHHLFIQCYKQTRGVRRIGLTSLNPKVCPSNQSESDPIRSKKKINPIQSEVKKSIRIRSEVEKSIQIRSNVKKINPIRSNPKQIYQIRSDQTLKIRNPIRSDVYCVSNYPSNVSQDRLERRLFVGPFAACYPLPTHFEVYCMSKL